LIFSVVYGDKQSLVSLGDLFCVGPAVAAVREKAKQQTSPAEHYARVFEESKNRVSSHTADYFLRPGLSAFEDTEPALAEN